MTDREREQDDGKSPGDEEVDQEKTKEEEDATVDHASEQSMDASDPPAW